MHSVQVGGADHLSTNQHTRATPLPCLDDDDDDDDDDDEIQLLRAKSTSPSVLAPLHFLGGHFHGPVERNP